MPAAFRLIFAALLCASPLFHFFHLRSGARGAEPVSLAGLGLRGGASWKPGRYGEVDQNRLRVRVPAEADDAAEMNCAEAVVDLSAFRGQALCFRIRLRAEGVSRPAKNWNGVKFMLHYIDADGQSFWHHPSWLWGDFDWKEVSFTCSISPAADKGLLKFGLQGSSGSVEFDLDSLTVESLFPPLNQDYRVSYPPRVRDTPLLRGVMSPQRDMTDDDLATLSRWGVTLVRAQLTRRWGQVGTDRDLDEYDRWLDGRLDHFAEVFAKAGPLGIRFVVDLHSPPGGRDESRNPAMFHEREYAEHFVRVWERIAGRFKGNPSVWAYDLVNEPHQSRPAPHDYWNLQRLAAEAIRRIDPDATLMVESNEWDSPSAFLYLSPLAMDNVIYQAHMYAPGTFTHQFVANAFGEKGRAEFVRYPGVIGGIAYDKERLRRRLKPVRDFQLRHNARIFIGEFSAVAWAPGAADYLRDCIEIFEEYGWDWTYHAFREWDGWSLEHEGAPGKLVPSPANDRLETLLRAFRGELRGR